MRLVKIYDEKTRMFPSGRIATKEAVYEKKPAATMFSHVIVTDESDQLIYSIRSLSDIREQYGIDSSLDDEQAVAKIQEIMNTPPDPVEPMPTTEERIAAALEYQNLLSL